MCVCGHEVCLLAFVKWARGLQPQGVGGCLPGGWAGLAGRGVVCGCITPSAACPQMQLKGIGQMENDGRARVCSA